MGLCKKCKYYTTAFALRKNNEDLFELIKAKIEQDKRLAQIQKENSSTNKITTLSEENSEDNTTDDNPVIEESGNNDESNNELDTPSESETSFDNNSTEEVPIVIPEDACFKWIIPSRFLNKRYLPFRQRREKFQLPPITPFDMIHICTNPEHIKIDHIKGDEWYRCCAVFNRFDECLLFENNDEVTEDSPVEDTILEEDSNTPTPPSEVLDEIGD